MTFLKISKFCVYKLNTFLFASLDFSSEVVMNAI